RRRRPGLAEAGVRRRPGARARLPASRLPLRPPVADLLGAGRPLAPLPVPAPGVAAQGPGVPADHRPGPGAEGDWRGPQTVEGGRVFLAEGAVALGTAPGHAVAAGQGHVPVPEARGAAGPCAQAG